MIEVKMLSLGEGQTEGQTEGKGTKAVESAGLMIEETGVIDMVSIGKSDQADKGGALAPCFCP